ncbi:MAG: hypothetical protein GWN32_02370 [Gemmatimonadetes bacterium]|nr:hypothetical protein [Gemmatimonadota bacterium]
MNCRVERIFDKHGADHPNDNDTMNDLATLANLAEILGAIVVIGGVVFAVIQIRLFRRQRLGRTSLAEAGDVG